VCCQPHDVGKQNLVIAQRHLLHVRRKEWLFLTHEACHWKTKKWKCGEIEKGDGNKNHWQVELPFPHSEIDNFSKIFH
jgi:hypothetical protein